MSEKKRIQDIASIRKLVVDIKSFDDFRRAMPIIRPLLRLLGVDTDKIDDAFLKFNSIKSEMDELITLPDKFNDLFSNYGWIMYGQMDVKIAKVAIARAEANDWDGAEEILVEYYSPETVAWKLKTMFAVKAFRPRMLLAEKALADYKDARYHACIPVILALLDGMVSEIHQERLGFFADESNLLAWDSIVAHDKGLNAIAKIFKQGRRTTVTETIKIPYRHGIMHGWDLGYDNKWVTAKTWAALFATREWAIQAERGLLEASSSPKIKTWSEIFNELVENQKTRQDLENWQPRQIEIGKDCPKNGPATAFIANTPEQKLAEFLNYWLSRNYGYMAKCLSKAIGYDEKSAPARVREIYIKKILNSFEFLEINDNAAAVSQINTLLHFKENGADKSLVVRFRLLCENPNGETTIRNSPNSNWRIANWGFS